ncbi:hypothetical protein V7087_16765 [Neobacillus niacini]|uniref:hypothetical protein n=1 Tax=Neobacillus niacini TaxID=86668 RepID=UPI002FFEAA3E
MQWQDFIVGVVSTLFAYALFSSGQDEEEIEMDPELYDNVVVNDFTQRGRLFRDYCESCRKQKQHREIGPRVFECTKCKRIRNLNAS